MIICTTREEKIGVRGRLELELLHRQMMRLAAGEAKAAVVEQNNKEQLTFDLTVRPH
jgi:hypothetical protein